MICTLFCVHVLLCICVVNELTCILLEFVQFHAQAVPLHVDYCVLESKVRYIQGYHLHVHVHAYRGSK